MPRIKGSRRARKQRRNQWAVVIPAQGSSGAGRFPHRPRATQCTRGEHGEQEAAAPGLWSPGAMLQGWPWGSPWVNADPWGTPRAGVGSRAGMLWVRHCPQPHPCPVPGPTGVCSHRSAGAWIPAPPPPEPARRLKGPHGAADKGGNANTLLGTGIPTI